MLTLSHLFAHDVIAQQFDAQAAEQAATGRVFAPFAQLLETAYGLELPTTTVLALKKINVYMAAQTSVKLASGPGSKVAAVVVWQALHAYGTALLAGMGERARKTLPADYAIAALPAWACPVALEAAKNKRAAEKAKRDAEKAEQERKNQLAIAAGVEAMKAKSAQQPSLLADSGTGDGTGDEGGAGDAGGAIPASAIDGAPRDLRSEMLAAWAKFAAFIDAGLMTATERDSFVAQLETATVAPEKTVDNKKAIKAARSKAQAADKAKAKATVQALQAQLSGKVGVDVVDGAVVGSGDGGADGAGAVVDGGAGNGSVAGLPESGLLPWETAVAGSGLLLTSAAVATVQ